MQIDPEEFRRHYESLSDEALLEVDRDELVPIARDCYDVELRHRGIRLESRAPAPSATPQPAASIEDWVVADTFMSAEQASLARSMLDSAEIPARLEAKGTGSWTGYGELRLLVPTSLLAEAKEVIASPISDEELIAQAEAEPTPDSEEDDSEH